MMYSIIYSKQAKNSLVQIYRYIAVEQQAPDNANRFINQLQEKTCALLSQHPKAGRLWKKDTRFIVVKRYVVLYEILADTVLILDIIVPGKNWRNII